MGIDGLKPHPPEKPPHSLGIYLIALSPQPGCHPPHPIKRSSGKLFIYKPHQLKITVIIDR